MAKRKAKKSRMPKTVARRRAVIIQREYSTTNRPKQYVCAVMSDSRRAKMVEVIVMSKPYRVACELANAAGRQSPDLTDREVFRQWTQQVDDVLKIVQVHGVTAFIERSVIEAMGYEWGHQADYLMHEDIRQYVAWCNHQIFELRLDDGRHCSTCRHSHYPKQRTVGFFYGLDHNASGLNAAIPDGYYKTTLKGSRP